MREAGQYCTNDDMREYVKFIGSLINKNAGASVNAKDGFPMKGYYVPVNLEIKELLSRSIEIKIECLGYEKEFIFYLSRMKGPDVLLHELQIKIDEKVNEIVVENNMDKDKIFHDYHPLRFNFGSKSK